MKKVMITIFMLIICSHIGNAKNNIVLTDSPIEDQIVHAQAVEIISAIANNIADLIICHKEHADAEIKKEKSINLLEQITAIISAIIIKLKNKSMYKSINTLEQQELDAMIENIAQRIMHAVDSQTNS